VLLLLPSSPGGTPDVPGLDKAVHAGLFALLAVTTRWRFGATSTALAGLVGYAVATEVAQQLLLPDRSGDPVDALADFAGIALGWWVLRRR
jgi:VanZ family protein